MHSMCGLFDYAWLVSKDKKDRYKRNRYVFGWRDKDKKNISRTFFGVNFCTFKTRSTRRHAPSIPTNLHLLCPKIATRQYLYDLEIEFVIHVITYTKPQTFPPIFFPLHAPIHVLTLGYILNDFVLAFKELFPRMYIINSQHQVSPWHYVIAEMHCRQAIALSSWRQEPCGIFHLPCCFIPFFVAPFYSFSHAETIIPLTPNSLTIFTILAFAFSFYAKISNGFVLCQD